MSDQLAELREREAFETWFRAVELGDGDVPLPTGPENGRQWDEYVQRHSLALGAWLARAVLSRPQELADPAESPTSVEPDQSAP